MVALFRYALAVFCLSVSALISAFISTVNTANLASRIFLSRLRVDIARDTLAVGVGWRKPSLVEVVFDYANPLLCKCTF